MTLHMAMGDGVEFDTIRKLLEVWGDLAVGIGDDAAVITPPPGSRLVLSTDAAVENVHFNPSWLSPEEIGGRAATAAMSDLAAMGAEAAAILISFTVPDAWLERLPAVASGIGRTVKECGARIVGGNMSAGEFFSITSTVVGFAVRPVKRLGATAGDSVVVTGRLGGPGKAITSLRAGREPSEWERMRLLHPVARTREGMWLAANGASAMIDISDGLAADALHLARASGVAIHLDVGTIPSGEGIGVREVLASGEEYELLATLPEVGGDDVVARFNARFGTILTRIGTVKQGEPGVFLHPMHASAANHGDLRSEVPGDDRVELPRGHDHFSQS